MKRFLSHGPFQSYSAFSVLLGNFILTRVWQAIKGDHRGQIIQNNFHRWWRNILPKLVKLHPRTSTLTYRPSLKGDITKCFPQEPKFSQKGRKVRQTARSAVEMSEKRPMCLGLPFMWLVVLGNEWACVCQGVQYEWLHVSKPEQHLSAVCFCGWQWFSR